MDLILAHYRLGFRGGAEVVLLQLARRFNPVIYTSEYSLENSFPEFKEFDVRIVPKNLGDVFGLPKGVRLLNYKIPQSYDVISAHQSPSELIRINNPRVCWTLHTPLREAFDMKDWYSSRLKYLQKTGPLAPVSHSISMGAFRFFENIAVSKIEKICPNSEVTNERLMKYLDRHDGEVVHPGIDPKAYSCDDYGKFFFYPSRLSAAKRHSYVIDAFKIFSSKHPGWKLVLAGFTSQFDAPYSIELRQMADSANIEIIENPSQEKMRQLYADCYATLFSAIDEDFGLVILEAMAASKPVISVNEGGPTYIILDGETGFLADSPKEMAERMSLLISDPALTEKMGKAGRNRVLGNFTVKHYLDRMEKIFKEVSAGKRA